MLLWAFVFGCRLGYEEMCFVAGTQVTMQSGFTKDIEDLQSGDTVLSYNVNEDAFVDRKVETLLRGTTDKLFTIKTENSYFKGVTAEHPFYQPDLNAWTPVHELEEGDRVLVSRHGRTRYERVLGLNKEWLERPVDVFNLSVEGPEHNYFANDILVHNKSIAVDYFAIQIRNLNMDWTYPLGEEHLLEGEHTLTGTLSLMVESIFASGDVDSNPWIGTFQVDMEATDLNGLEDPIENVDCGEPLDVTSEDFEDDTVFSRNIECTFQFKPGQWEITGTVVIDAETDSSRTGAREEFQHIVQVYESGDATDGDE